MQSDSLQSNAARRARRNSWIALACVATVAATLIFWQLGARYLWQDEAACAVLAERLMQTGKPLAYDGRNLITMDEFRAQEGPELLKLSHDEARTVQHFVEHGDFKADTTWIGQPWGQFVAAGVSLALFGKDTFQARLPFAIAAVLTVLLLFHFARSRFADQRIAWIAVALLLTNTYWFLHARQCRYYSTATLGLLATLFAYYRWQERKRFGASLFVVCGWLWFHNDFGSPWPVFGILFLDALRASRVRWRNTLATFAILGLALVPFVFFYELTTRIKASFKPWDYKFNWTLFTANQFQLPLLIAAAAAVFLVLDRRRGPSAERRIVGLCLAIFVAKLLWMPTVGPSPFYRYIVDMTPLSSLIIAYTVTRIATSSFKSVPWQTVLAGALAGIQIVSSLFAEPVSMFFPIKSRPYSLPGWIVRPELKCYAAELAASSPDPNRETIEYLRPMLKPGDEILVNYEDCPWMFYTSNRICGGIPAFRVFDDKAPPPRFVVFRRTVTFIHKPIFTRAFAPSGEIDPMRWNTLPAHILDMIWGNNPDPGYVYSQQVVKLEEFGNPDILILEARAEH
jgi:Dolichyl-phosphate-mannose-protein mannosyltransferase